HTETTIQTHLGAPAAGVGSRIGAFMGANACGAEKEGRSSGVRAPATGPDEAIVEAAMARMSISPEPSVGAVAKRGWGSAGLGLLLPPASACRLLSENNTEFSLR